MNGSGQRDDSSAPRPKLAEALSHIAKESVFVPPQVDRAILAQARAKISRRRSARRSIRFAWAAAAILAAGSFSGFYIRFGRDRAATLADVNHDGRIDILDAFALARELKSGAKPSPRLDLNHDGVVDEQDVRLLAAQAVELDRRPGL